jgi:hypothetical protein
MVTFSLKPHEHADIEVADTESIVANSTRAVEIHIQSCLGDGMTFGSSLAGARLVPGAEATLKLPPSRTKRTLKVTAYNMTDKDSTVTLTF